MSDPSSAVSRTNAGGSGALSPGSGSVTVRVDVLRLPASLEAAMTRPVAVSGTVTQQNADGTAHIRTPHGEVLIRSQAQLVPDRQVTLLLPATAGAASPSPVRTPLPAQILVPPNALAATPPPGSTVGTGAPPATAPPAATPPPAAAPLPPVSGPAPPGAAPSAPLPAPPASGMTPAVAAQLLAQSGAPPPPHIPAGTPPPSPTLPFPTLSFPAQTAPGQTAPTLPATGGARPGPAAPPAPGVAGGGGGGQASPLPTGNAPASPPGPAPATTADTAAGAAGRPAFPAQMLSQTIASLDGVRPGQAGQPFPALRELLSVLGQAAPEAARQAVSLTLPQANQALAGTALFFLAAVRGGDIRSWLGQQAGRALEAAGRGEILGRVAAEIGAGVRTVVDGAGGDWRVHPIPLFHHGQVEEIRLFVRQRCEEDEAAEDRWQAGQRFVFDLTLSRLGPIQIDGLIRQKRLALMVRSQDTLALGLRRDMQVLFADALEAVGFTGTLTFQSGRDGWIRLAAGKGLGGEALQA